MMNRSGLKISRILANCQLRNFETITPTLSKSLHVLPKNEPHLVFTPRTILMESQKRFLFSKKETEAEAPKADEAAEEISENEKVLNERVIELEERSADLLDKYKRSLADFENLRNRMNKQVADAKIFGIQGFCKVRETSADNQVDVNWKFRISLTLLMFSTKLSAWCQRNNCRSSLSI